VSEASFTWPPALPLVAILRGLSPESAVDVGHTLYAAGFRVMEVPLNRPGALDCIAQLVAAMPADTLVGAGTVTETSQVDAVIAAGGRLIVSPHADPAVIAYARSKGMYVVPGVLTPTEAFAALRAGAHALKIFPAEALGEMGFKALASVMPAGTLLWPVGGVTPGNMRAWRQYGASGFGIGGALFQPGMRLDDIADRAASMVAAWQSQEPE